MKRTLFPSTAIALTLLFGGCQSSDPADAWEMPPSSPAVQPLGTVSSLSEMPYTTDSTNGASWWGPMDEFNGNTYVAFNGPGTVDENHTVRVAKRTSSGWSASCMKTSSGACVTYTDDFGHNQPSLAVDGDGYVHAFMSMHNDGWRYFRSNSPEDVSAFTNRSAEMPDGSDGYTYPVLTRAPDGDVYLIVRARPSGETTAPGRLYRWNDASNVWSRVATFANRSGYAVYPDDIKADADGNLHIAYEWHLAPAGPVRHLGSYVKYEPSTGTWYKASGSQVSLPLTPGSSDVYQPFEGPETWSENGDEGAPGMQTAKMAVNPANKRPSLVYRYRPTRDGNMTVRAARWTGSEWLITPVYDLKYDTEATMEITDDGTTVRAYWVKKTSPQELWSREKGSTSSNGFGGGKLIATGKRLRLDVKMRSGGTDVLYIPDQKNLKAYVATHTR